MHLSLSTRYTYQPTSTGVVAHMIGPNRACYYGGVELASPGAKDEPSLSSAFGDWLYGTSDEAL